MSSLHLRGVQMIPEKIKLQKYLKIRNGMKNVKNPHIFCTLPILHFFEIFFKKIGTSYDLNIV